MTFGLAPIGTGSSNSYGFEGTAGAKFQAQIEVLNISALPITLRLYSTDASTSATGAFTVPDAGTPSHGAGLWTDLNNRVLTLKPHQTLLVPFAVSIPFGAEPGDKAGAIIASTVHGPKTGSGSAVAVDTRVGIPLYVRVSGIFRPEVSVAGLNIRYSGNWSLGPGTATITYRIVNTGNVRLIAKQAVVVSSLFQSVSSPTLGDTRPILPGDYQVESVVIHGVWPAGLATAAITLTGVAVDNEVHPRPASATSTSFLAISYPDMGILLLLLLVAAFFIRRTISRRRGGATGGGRRRAKSSPARKSTGRRKASASVGAATFSALGVMVSGLLALLVAALGASPAEASNISILPLVINPAVGDNDAVLTLSTTDSCPAPANATQAVIFGSGFLPIGQNLTAVNKPGTSNTHPFYVSVSMSMRDLAGLMPNPQGFSGLYKIVVTCRLLNSPTPMEQFVGYIRYLTPGAWVAVEPPGSVATVPPVVPPGIPPQPTQAGGILVTPPKAGGTMLPTPPPTGPVTEPSNLPTQAPTPSSQAANTPAATPAAVATSRGTSPYVFLGAALLLLAVVIFVLDRLRSRSKTKAS